MNELSDKFIYENDKEIQMIDSQCEACIYYNSGKYSDNCPKERIDEIKKNLISCEKKRIFSVLD